MLKNFPEVRIIGKEIVFLPKCHSTNDTAADMIRQGTGKEGMVIFSDYQSAGRGQGGNKWESEEGKNLTFSIILSPDFLKADKNFYLNMAVTLGIHDSLNPLLGDELKIKWPNDIYYSGKKLGGILIENSIRSGMIESSVAGIGLNVLQENFRSDRAVSVRSIIHTGIDRLEIFKKIIHGLDLRYEQLRRSGLDELSRDYLSVLYRFNEESYYRSSGKFTGRITGIDEYGRLVVESGGTSKAFSTKEIEFLDE